MLDTTIRQVDRVGSLHIACSVAALTSAEHSLGVVVGHCVAVGVGKDLVRVVGWFSVVGRLHWGVVSRCSWGSVGVSVVSWCRGGVGGCRSSCGCRGGIGRGWSWGRGWCRSDIGWGRGVVRWGMVWSGSCSCDQAKKDLHVSCDGTSSTVLEL